jgi:hypothetical protein
MTINTIKKHSPLRGLGALFLLFALPSLAQDGGISPEMLAKIQQTRPQGNAEKALVNAMATMSINDLAKNAAKLGKIDTKFSIETPKQSIHNQKSSGRCWMFSSMNVLRSRFALEHKDTLAVEYSQDYLFFYDQLEKANLFLQGVIETASKSMDDPDVKFFFRSPLSDGGTFCGIIDLTKKYGLVPKSVRPETYQAENTRLMSNIIETKLREYGLELRSMVAAKKKATAINSRKTEMLSEVYRILSMTLGEPVKEFSFASDDPAEKEDLDGMSLIDANKSLSIPRVDEKGQEQKYYWSTLNGSVNLFHADIVRGSYRIDTYEEKYGIVLRSKGMVPDAEGRWVHFDYVPEETEVRYGAADVTGKSCGIGAQLKEDALADLFRK